MQSPSMDPTLRIVQELMKIMQGQADYDVSMGKGSPPGPDDVERTSLAGVLRGTVRLMTGEIVPVIHPELRGMIYWNSPDLAKKVSGGGQPIMEGIIEKFLERICF